MHPTSAIPPRTPETIARLLRAAQGEEKADLAVINAKVLNVFTGEVHQNYGVSVNGEWIVRVCPDVSDTIGPTTRVIDAAGATLIPGFIDGHAHMGWIFTPAAFVPFSIAAGVTTVVTETLEIYPVAGIEGLLDYLDALQDQPVRFFATAPAMVSYSEAARGIAAEHLKRLMDREDVLGLGEAYWQAVLQAPEVYLPAYCQTLRSGKVIEGHTAGAAEKKLAAYACAGVTSCHEPINAEQTLSRMRLGIHVMAREGSIRQDLAEIAKIKDMGVDLRRLVFASDGISPQDLVAGKYLNAVVQKGIDCGFSPVSAIQAATLNVAEHFRLDGLLGAIAPGRLADMLLIPDLKTIAPRKVICRGKVVLENGQCLLAGRSHAFSPDSRNTFRFSRDFEASDFRIACSGGPTVRKVRVIEMVTDLVTKEQHLELAVVNGEIPADPSRNICKVAAVDRRNHPGKRFTGLIRGFGLTSGAFASSAAWDVSDIVVVGCTDADIAHAVNRLRALQGGAVLCENGKILAEMALPIFGLLSDASMQDLADRMIALRTAAAGRGVGFPDPFLSLNALTGAAIPYLRICSQGLVNLKDGIVSGVFL